MKTPGRTLLVYSIVALAFAVLGAAAVIICVKVFHLTVLTAGMVSLPVSYILGMLAVWALASRGRKD
ncbi:MAG: hypothetical protein JWO82_1052 [Akkermansiaceae bacterium]|nr:hypothetical protein [Akkermansiaceae bacterium]